MAKQGHKSKKFLILGEKEFLYNSDDKMGLVLMSAAKRILKWGEGFRVEVKKSQSVKTNEFRLAVLDKTRVVYEESFKLRDKKALREIDFGDLDLINGGVLTVQLYKSKNTTEALQEMLIYVEPKQKLGIELEFDQKRYAPKDQVNLGVTVDGNKQALVGVVVSDETAYLEIEKRNHPVSFCSKVFLEKELHFKSGEWVNSVKYIDDFFENSEKTSRNQNAKEDLEYLLGVQDWRLFFLTEQKIREFIKAPKQNREDSMKHLLGLSKESINSLLNPPVRKRRPKRKGRGRGRGMLRKKEKRVRNDMMADGKRNTFD